MVQLFLLSLWLSVHVWGSGLACRLLTGTPTFGDMSDLYVQSSLPSLGELQGTYWRLMGVAAPGHSHFDATGYSVNDVVPQLAIVSRASLQMDGGHADLLSWAGAAPVFAVRTRWGTRDGHESPEPAHIVDWPNGHPLKQGALKFDIPIYESNGPDLFPQMNNTVVDPAYRLCLYCRRQATALICMGELVRQHQPVATITEFLWFERRQPH